MAMNRKDDNKDEIEIRRPIDQLVIGHIPVWLLFAGNALILAVLVLLLFISFKMTFPEVVSGSVVVSGNRVYVKVPPARKDVIREGQEVVMRINEYPYVEYGVVQGRVSAEPDSLVPAGALMVPVVPCEEKNKVRNADLIEGMSGSGEIIIGQKPIIYRIIRTKTFSR